MSKGTKHFFVCCTHVVVNIIKQQGKRSAAKLGNLKQETRVDFLCVCNFQDLKYLYNRIKHLKELGKSTSGITLQLINL